MCSRVCSGYQERHYPTIHLAQRVITGEVQPSLSIERTIIVHKLFRAKGVASIGFLLAVTSYERLSFQ